ncbi:MAG: hypothetical protein Kow0090_02620 [Myxococcota bacterium]
MGRVLFLAVIAFVLTFPMLAYGMEGENPTTSSAVSGEAEQPPPQPIKTIQVPQPMPLPTSYKSPLEKPEISTVAPIEDEFPATNTFRSDTALGGMMTSGNTNTRSVVLDSKSIYNLIQWAFILNLFGAYGSTRYAPEGKSIETVRYYGGTFKDLWFWTEERTNYLFNQAGLVSNIYEGYDLRAFVEGGLGRSWFGNRVDLTLRTELGVNYTHDELVEFNMEGEDSDDILSALLYFGAEYNVNTMLSLGEDFRMLVNLADYKDYRMESKSFLIVRLNTWFALTGNLTMKYDSTPALIQQIDSVGRAVLLETGDPKLIDAEKLDMMLSLSIVLSFYED